MSARRSVKKAVAMLPIFFLLCCRVGIPLGFGELDDVGIGIGIEILAIFAVFHRQFFESAPGWISVAEQTAQIKRLRALSPAAATCQQMFHSLFIHIDHHSR